jgi:hypothetical protein
MTIIVQKAHGVDRKELEYGILFKLASTRIVIAQDVGRRVVEVMGGRHTIVVDEQGGT